MAVADVAGEGESNLSVQHDMPDLTPCVIALGTIGGIICRNICAAQRRGWGESIPRRIYFLDLAHRVQNNCTTPLCTYRHFHTPEGMRNFAPNHHSQHMLKINSRGLSGDVTGLGLECEGNSSAKGKTIDYIQAQTQTNTRRMAHYRERDPHESLNLGRSNIF